MAARVIPRPAGPTLTSPEDIFDWLRYLCLNSDCRGLGGFELARCPELLSLTICDSDAAESDNPQQRAERLRRWLRNRYQPSANPAEQPAASDRAILLLLGLLPVATVQPRVERRRLAAQALGMTLDTFQRRYEPRLLMDVADELWRTANARS